MFKIFKAAADMQQEEVEAELQKALADEKKELEAAAVLERHCTLVHIEIKNLDKWDSAR